MTGMRDGAHLFYEEVRERTELARHALRKRCGRNVIGFNRYTRAELQNLNGPVRTYSMAQSDNRPCST